MIYIFAGEDQVKSRQAYLKKLSQHKEVTQLAGEVLDLNTLIQACESQGLWSSNTVAIERLTQKRKSKERDQIFMYLGRMVKDQDISIYIWEPKSVPKWYTSGLPGAKVDNYQLPKTFFAVLDNFSPATKVKFLNLIDECKKNYETDFIWYMLINHLRKLYYLSLAESAPISSQRYKAKLLNQVNSFSKNQLTDIFNWVTRVDFERKQALNHDSTDSLLDKLVLKL